MNLRTLNYYLMFLNNVVEDILSKRLMYRDLYVIMPNRRSANCMREIFKNKLNSASWIPQIFAIKDLIFDYTGMEPVDNFDLLFLLYKEFQSSFKKEHVPEFSDFIFLGSYILGDFDMIAKELHEKEIQKLFRYIDDYKLIDAKFSYLDEKQRKALADFWKNIEETENENFIKKYFVDLWNALWPIYQNINLKLSENNLGYEAMAYRKYYDTMLQQPIDKLPVFCLVGFNALTKIQSDIFTWLRENNKAFFYWDYDNRFDFSNSSQFVKKNMEMFGNGFSLHNSNMRWNPKLYEYCVPTNTLQVNVLEKILQNTDDKETTCVILNDESILIQLLPVFDKMPNQINISIGVSMSQLATVQLIQQIVAIIQSQRSDAYYYKTFINLLENPFIVFISETFFINKFRISDMMSYLNTYSISYINQNQLNQFFPKSFLELIYCKTITESFNQWQSFFNHVLFEDNEDPITEFYQSSIHITSELLEKSIKAFNSINGNNTERQSYRLFLKIFNMVVDENKIHFQSTRKEKSSNIQVMGLLETRLLDFDNIIMLSANDEFLPKLNHNHSIIPFKIKKAYGLPTLENQEAIYSYTFYRLLYRAKQVHFIYSNIQDEMNTSEKSRFIYQLQYLSGILLNAEKIAFKPLSSPNNDSIRIPKTEEIINKITNRDFSASSLSIFLHCPLHFYFRYIKELKELDEIQEDINAKSMGNIFHKVMAELLPKGFYTSSTIENIIKDKKFQHNLIREKFLDEFQGTNPNHLNNNGLFIYLNETITFLINKTLRYDLKFVPFEILGSEKRVSKLLQITANDKSIPITLNGFIDRYDKRKNDIHIIDYKTGRVNKKKFLGFNQLFTIGDDHNLEHRDYIFQLFLYAFMLRNPSEKQTFYLRNYAVVSTMKEDKDTCYLSDNTKLEVDNEFLDEYENHLQKLIREIIDINKPFEQQKTENNCKYCEFLNICW